MAPASAAFWQWLRARAIRPMSTASAIRAKTATMVTASSGTMVPWRCPDS